MFNRRKKIVMDPVQSAEQEFFKPKLIFTEDMLLEKEDEYLFRYHANQLPALRSNQLSVEALQLDASTYPVSVISLFRNTLEHSFQIDGLPLLMLDERKQLIGRKVLSTEDIPEFIAMSSIPCWLDFHDEEIFISDDERFPENITLLFSLEETHHLELGESLSTEEQKRVKQVFYSTPTLTNEELNVLSVSSYQADGKLVVLLLIRNGYKQSIQLGTLPVELYAENQVFESHHIHIQQEIEAHTTIPVRIELDVTHLPHEGEIALRVAR
ncbi:SLAP domain-containing protein [Exiguobacterium undae]